MAYYYRTVRCPSCDEVAEYFRVEDGQVLMGSLLRTCPHCGKSYFDTGYHEPALVCLQTGEKALRGGIYGLCFAALCAVMLAQAAGGSRLFLLPALLFAALAAFHGRNVFRTNRRMILKKDIIAYLEGTAGEQTEEVKESLKRLCSAEYLDALRAHGVSVPSYFYDRVQAEDASA